MDAAQREQLFESVRMSLPVGRVGEAHDVAHAYLFLMQEGFNTGQTIVIDVWPNRPGPERVLRSRNR